MRNFILLLAIFGLFSCKKSTDGTIITGKVVYRSCASIVVQVTDSSHFYLGENGWQQKPNKGVYDNVFTVANTCSFGPTKEGQSFTFTVLPRNPNPGDCVVCALYDNPPAKKHAIKVINPSL